MAEVGTLGSDSRRGRSACELCGSGTLAARICAWQSLCSGRRSVPVTTTRGRYHGLPQAVVLGGNPNSGRKKLGSRSTVCLFEPFI